MTGVPDLAADLDGGLSGDLPAGPGRRVLVHVGAPKTGTSFVQDVLWLNRESLAEQGILYPADRFDEHFLAALDLMELPWGGLEQQAVGSWDRLAERVRAWPGTSIVSHEILARASRQQVRRALDSFGDIEVHVVLSARDLVRQIPAEWQENVKHRRTIGYRDFLDQVTDPTRTGSLASWFWGVQEVPDVLDRWGGTLLPERVHLVTVPKPGADRGLLWDRFAAVLGLDAALAPATTRANPSLGVPETELVRRINGRVGHGVLVGDDYRTLVRELLVHRTLSQRVGSPRLGLPDDVRQWAVALSQEWVEGLRRRGYDVAGSLEELLPDEVEGPGFADPDQPDEHAVADAAAESMVVLLREVARLGETERVLRRDLGAAWEELERSRSPWFRLKRRLVGTAADHRWAAAGLAAYRRVRSRSSRSA